MDLDNPTERKAYRQSLFGHGYEEVKYLLRTKKISNPKKVVATQTWLEDYEAGRNKDEELHFLADKIAMFVNRFVDSDTLGRYLETDDEALFEREVLHALDIIDEEFGALNQYSSKIRQEQISGSSGMLGGPSQACVERIGQTIRGAGDKLNRQKTRPLAAKAANSASLISPYIDTERMSALRNIKSNEFDLTRLIRMCEEINECFEAKQYFSVAFLLRAVLNHIPPIFGFKTFKEVANNYSTASTKKSFLSLDGSMRTISDDYQHRRIGSIETLPNEHQIDVKRDFDVLLAAIIRELKSKP